MKIFVISSGKQDSNVQLLKRQYPSTELFDAVNGYDVSSTISRLMDTDLVFTSLEIPTYGMLACWLSKYFLWVRQVEEEWPFMCCMEDNFVPEGDFASVLEQQKLLFQDDSDLDAIASGNSGECYLTSLNGARKLLNNLRSRGICLNIDHQVEMSCKLVRAKEKHSLLIAEDCPPTQGFQSVQLSQLVNTFRPAYKDKFRNTEIADFVSGLRLDYLEGHTAHCVAKTNDLKRLVTKEGRALRVLEIGFNAGHSSGLFLAASPNATVLSFDIAVHTYVHLSKFFIDIKYPGQHRLVIGDSLSSIPAHIDEEPFDVIFVDGCHRYEHALLDVMNCKRFSSSETLLIIDDIIVSRREWEAEYTTGPSAAYLRLIQDKVVNQTKEYEYSFGMGIATMRYVH